MADRYGVIGSPIAQSKSPQIHLAFAQDAGQSIEYDRIEGAVDGFAAQLDGLRREGYRGLNVTAPLKLAAFACATQRSQQADLAGAANCLTFLDDGGVRGDNFDGIGLVRDIVHNLGVAIAGKRVLMLGAGGAARGALLPLLAEPPACLAIVNRTVAHAEALRTAAGGAVEVGSYGTLDTEPFDIVLNATSCSLTGVLPPVSRRAFTPRTTAYELAYAKGLTPFLRLAAECGVDRMADGVGMLVEQAAEAFALWRGVRPATRATIDALTVPLR